MAASKGRRTGKRVNWSERFEKVKTFANEHGAFPVMLTEKGKLREPQAEAWSEIVSHLQRGLNILFVVPASFGKSRPEHLLPMRDVGRGTRVMATSTSFRKGDTKSLLSTRDVGRGTRVMAAENHPGWKWRN